MLSSADLERQIRALTPGQRFRLLTLMARRYPASVNDGLLRVRKTRDIRVLGIALTPPAEEPAEDEAIA